jgi:pimeloyl-ACP methyl ester carboxylesterase
MTPTFLEKKEVETEAGKIFYFRDISFPGKPCVVLLHGLSSNHTTWTRIIESLHASGYNSIAVDLRGHGLSDKTINKPLYTWPVFAGDLRRILEAEKIGKCVIAGYSFGGVIAQEFVARYPENVSGLVLISANHSNPLIYMGMRYLTPVAVGCLNFLAFLFRLQRRKNFFYYEHTEVGGYWVSVMNGLTTMPISINFWMLAQCMNIDYSKSLPNIRVPVYIMCGKKDAFLSMAEAKDMNDAIPESTIIVSKNPNHFVASCSQDETSNVIIDFLKRYEDRNL